MYVYIKSEPGLWTVGFYTPKGEWISESDHGNKAEAAYRVHYLNGMGCNSVLDQPLNEGDGVYRP